MKVEILKLPLNLLKECKKILMISLLLELVKNCKIYTIKLKNMSLEKKLMKLLKLLTKWLNMI